MGEFARMATVAVGLGRVEIATGLLTVGWGV